MRRVGIVFLIFLFLLLVGGYITAFQNPFVSSAVLKLAEVNNFYTDNEVVYQIPTLIKNGLIWELIDFRVFYAWLALIAATIGSFIAFLHLLIDKLFFRKFYEQPSLVLAIRRGFFVSLIIVGSIFFRLINGFEWYNIASLTFLFACIEVLFVVFKN